MSEKAEAKNRRKWLLITLAINVVIVAYIAIKEFGGGTGGSVSMSLREIKPGFLLCGLGCFAIAAFMEYLKFRQLLMTSEGKFDRRGAFECAMLGKYYDNVTPLGAGGQPFQMHYLKKRGYSSGTSVAAPTMSFIVQHIAFVLISGAVFIYADEEAQEAAGALSIAAYGGLGFYALLPISLLTFMIIPKPLRTFIHWLVRSLAKIRFGSHCLIKDADATADKWLDSLDESVQCLRIYAKRPIVVLKLLLESILSQAVTLLIQFYMLRAFGGTGHWWSILSIAVYINASITIIPTPGNAGAAEGSFYVVFSALEGGRLFWAMTAWRILVYYSWLICGFVILIRSAQLQKKPGRICKHEGDRLRVMLFTDTFLPSDHPSARVSDAYARNINAAGEYACVICPKGEKAPTEVSYDLYQTPTVPCPVYIRRMPTVLPTRALIRDFKRDPPDIIHAHSPFFVGKLALRMAKKRRIPVVSTFQSDYSAEMLKRTHLHLLAEMIKHLVVSFYVRSDYVWAPSYDMALILRRYGYNGTIFVMENAANEKEWGTLIPRVLTAYKTHSSEGHTQKLPGIFENQDPAVQIL